MEIEEPHERKIKQHLLSFRHCWTYPVEFTLKKSVGTEPAICSKGRKTQQWLPQFINLALSICRGDVCFWVYNVLFSCLVRKRFIFRKLARKLNLISFSQYYKTIEERKWALNSIVIDIWLWNSLQFYFKRFL